MTTYLIINAALFLSMLFIIHYYISKEPIFIDSPLKSRCILGFSYGCVSVLLMFFQFDNRLVDLRHLPILLAAFYGGWASALPAWVVASWGCYFLLAEPGRAIVPILILSLDAIIGLMIPQLIRSERISWIVTVLLDVFMRICLLPQIVGIKSLGFWMAYVVVSLLGGAVSFHLTESLRKSQQTLLELRKSQEDMEDTVQHLHQTKEQLESYITHNADAIVILDIEERIVKVNPAFEKIFGWRAEEVMGCKLLPWIPIEQQEEGSQLRRKTMTNGSVIGYEATRTRKNGDMFYASVSASTIYDSNGNAVGFSGVYRDITEQKQTDELLRNTEKLSVVGELAAGIAHEIRNPLTTLKGFTQLMRKEYPSFYLDIMGDELDRIETIANEFLYLAKPLAAEIKTVSTRELIEQVTLLLTPQAILNDIELSIDAEENLPMMTCIENQLKQVFINLIKNAIEAMPHGGIIRVGIKREGDRHLLFSVSDTGTGIPEDRIDKLGQPFYSLKEKGTGLGLTICKKIIHEHNGTVTFHSLLGKGTTVKIRLPYSSMLT